MKKAVLCLAVVGLLTSVKAPAVIGTIDDVPAATLLLPYFEVDLANTGGITTLMSINNASATAVLAHVTFWTDQSRHTIDFNVYLTGYDVQTINLADIFVLGNLPRTASAGQDPGDTISPKGAKSQDINFASCNGILPIPPLGAAFINQLQNAHTGLVTSLVGNGTACAGTKFGDRIARGYITVDTVNNCTLRFPGDLGYFAAGGTGDATNQNVLWGDVFFVNPAQNFADGENLVHIEASATDTRTSVVGDYTFYGRYLAYTAADNRESLASNFAARFVNGGAFSGGTSYKVWRDGKLADGNLQFSCAVGFAAQFPLGNEGLVIFDEQEHPDTLSTCQVSPCLTQTNIPFPIEAQKVKVGATTPFVSIATPLVPSSNFGWMFLDLNTTVVAQVAGQGDPAAAQAWVQVEMDANGRFSVGYNAVKLDTTSCPTASVCANHIVP